MMCWSTNIYYYNYNTTKMDVSWLMTSIGKNTSGHPVANHLNKNNHITNDLRWCIDGAVKKDNFVNRN